MCVHIRIIYTCGHYAWGGKDLLDCNVQKAWKQGIWSAECDTMTSHPLKTFKVTQLCTMCVEKKSKTDETLSETKMKIAGLTADLKRLKETKAKRAQDEMDEKTRQERERAARLEDGRSSGSEVKPSPVDGDLEEVKKIKDELEEVLGYVPELEGSSSDEDMSLIRTQIKKEIREVRRVKNELEDALRQVPDVESSSDESLSPIKPTMSG